MLLSKDEATQALQDIDAAQQRTYAMQCYRNAAPYFVLWGCVWLLANSLTELRPDHGGNIWRALTLLGSAITVWLIVRSARQHSATVSSRSLARKRSRQLGVTWLVIIGYFIANSAVLPHLDAKQGNAYISLFWAFIYVLMGVWMGWRIFTVGILTAASILIGYFMITTHYFLWMGLVTGSLLILGGLWLRKV